MSLEDQVSEIYEILKEIESAQTQTTKKILDLTQQDDDIQRIGNYGVFWVLFSIFLMIILF